MAHSEADFFDQHLSKMLVAPSFEQGPPQLPANAGWHPECSTQPDARLRAGDSEASTQSSDGRQHSAQVDRHTDRHPSASSGDGLTTNAFSSMNVGGYAAPPSAPHHHALPAPPPAASTFNFDAVQDPMSTMQMSPRSSPKAAMPAKYNVGDAIEVWSNSHKRWSQGTVEKVEAPGKLSVKYMSPDGQAMMKQMPDNHEHLRHAVAAVAPASVTLPSAQSMVAGPAGAYKAGDQVEIWSNSQKAWCRGSVEKIQGDLVSVKYVSPDGQTMTKLMPDGHEYLRHLEQQVVPPPPPPPGRSSHNSSMNEVPRPSAESAVGEDSSEMQAYIHACETSHLPQDASNAMSSMNAMASQSAMASQQAMPRTKGYSTPAANPNHKVASYAQDEIFVAESTSWVPGGGMALCGMPIKANKKQEVALNDDGTPVARCTDIDRCCRCSMPIGSYFDHTCPRCQGIVCLACMDDIKMVIASYRCPCCGDQHYNEEALKQTLWYLKFYRNAQRAVGAVPILFAGLFGYGPEGSGTRNAKQAFIPEEEFLDIPANMAVAPVAQPKAKPAASNAPPPPPPKPKAKAKAAPGSQEVPEYHTRPPAGWAEGAGAWRPGQAGGSPPDPSKVAAAMHQAAKAQAAGGRRPSAGSDPNANQVFAQSAGRGANPFGSAVTGQSPMQSGQFQTRVPVTSPMR